MSDKPLDRELNEFEARLATLRPAEARLVRDELMYQAGVRAASSASAMKWSWPLATAASTLIAITLGVLLLTASRPNVARQEATPSASRGRAQNDKTVPAAVGRLHHAHESDDGALQKLEQPYSYGRLREIVLTEGVDAMPTAAFDSIEERHANPAGNRRLLHDLLKS